MTKGISHFVAFIGINKDIKAPAHNVWYLPCDANYDLEKMIKDYT